jgi:hypothetical protein
VTGRDDLLSLDCRRCRLQSVVIVIMLMVPALSTVLLLVMTLTTQSMTRQHDDYVCFFVEPTGCEPTTSELFDCRREAPRTHCEPTPSELFDCRRTIPRITHCLPLRLRALLGLVGVAPLLMQQGPPSTIASWCSRTYRNPTTTTCTVQYGSAWIRGGCYCTNSTLSLQVGETRLEVRNMTQVM